MFPSNNLIDRFLVYEEEKRLYVNVFRSIEFNWKLVIYDSKFIKNENVFIV